jgi:acetyl esterase/lipase
MAHGDSSITPRDRVARLASTLSLVSAVLAGWLTVKPRIRGLTSNLVGYGLKIVGGALSPLIAVMGLLGAMLSRRSGLPSFVFLGGVGAILASRYVHRVSVPHDGFVRAFGQDVSILANPRMLRRRWHIGQVVKRPAPRFTRNVAFASIPGADGAPSRDLLCDLWTPPVSMARSGVGMIYLHGGAWQSFDKDVGTRPFFRHLTSLGHVVMDVSYRIVPETDMQGMLGDAKRAISWLKANAVYLDVNPERVVVSGGSAGGHLALMAAYTANSPDFDPGDVRSADTSVRGVVVYYPVPDLRTLKDYWSEQSMNPLAHALGRSLGYFSRAGYLRWTDLAERLFGGPVEEIGDLLLTYSPVAHVGDHCPPTLILQGQHDHVIPLVDVRALYESLVAAGRQAVLVELPQVEHAFDMFALQASPPAQSALYDVERFLALMA